MFTGLIEETGSIRRIQRASRSLLLTVSARVVLEGIRLGDSIAVNGVCLTVVRFDTDSFTADVVPETFEKTGLSRLSPGAVVNLERTMALGDRFGGHIVQGHIDGTGTIAAMERDEIAVFLTVQAPQEILRYVVAKGSIAIDGISLTVVDVHADRFRVSLIPHTVSITAMRDRRPGDIVNLEADILGKYVERLLTGRVMAAPPTDPVGTERRGGITEAFLREKGF